MQSLITLLCWESLLWLLGMSEMKKRARILPSMLPFSSIMLKNCGFFHKVPIELIGTMNFPITR